MKIDNKNEKNNLLNEKILTNNIGITIQNI